MKPKTKNECEVARLAPRIPGLNKHQRKWIERNAVPANAYQYKQGGVMWAWCGNCGYEFVDDGKIKRCAMCGAKIVKREYKPTKHISKGKYYTTLHTTCNGWQVSRHFLVEHQTRRGGMCYFDANEAVQIWTNINGEQVINARPCRPLSFYSDDWNWNEPLSIKRRKPYCYKYDIFSYGNRICSVLPTLRRNGFNGTFHGVMPDDLWRLLLTDNFAETLFKCGQYRLVSMLADGGTFDRAVAMVCVRHGYIINDAYMWRDYIEMAKACGYDVHNPRYCCPGNLKVAHDRMQKIKERKALELKISTNEPIYHKRVAKYLGVVIKGKGLTIQPLQTVRDFYDEGKKMHHCVFVREYYSKNDSLVLSARDDKGKRIETVEFSLKKGRVVQCYGKFDKPTALHDDIIKLVNKNAKLILTSKNLQK